MSVDERIPLSEAARRSGVAASTLRRWAEDGVLPVRRGRWTAAAAAQARVVARMRERGHSLEDLKRAGREGRLAFGYAEDLFSEEPVLRPVGEVAAEVGLEPELIDRILTILGAPKEGERQLGPADVEAVRQLARILDTGFPLVALLQLVRVYAQSMRRIADAEVRLFHLYVHEPLIRDGLRELEMAEEIGGLAAATLPFAGPLIDYMHTRFLRFFLEQDVVGHMESDLGVPSRAHGEVTTALCFIDITGFTRYTEEEGDLEAIDVVEDFVETVETTLPQGATIVKTIGDEVMVVAPDPAALTAWALRFLQRYPEWPRPRVGIHYAEAVYRDGDYFGTHVNLAHRVVDRAQAGEVLVTDRVVASSAGWSDLSFSPIGEARLRGFPRPTPLFLVRAEPSSEERR